MPSDELIFYDETRRTWYVDSDGRVGGPRRGEQVAWMASARGEEFRIAWIDLAGRSSCHVRAFSDGWEALSVMMPTLLRLPDNPSPDELRAALVEDGWREIDDRPKDRWDATSA
jgi:hypothetical protein